MVHVLLLQMCLYSTWNLIKKPLLRGQKCVKKFWGWQQQAAITEARFKHYIIQLNIYHTHTTVVHWSLLKSTNTLTTLYKSWNVLKFLLVYDAYFTLYIYKEPTETDILHFFIVILLKSAFSIFYNPSIKLDFSWRGGGQILKLND